MNNLNQLKTKLIIAKNTKIKIYKIGLIVLSLCFTSLLKANQNYEGDIEKFNEKASKTKELFALSTLGSPIELVVASLLHLLRELH